MRPLSPYRRPLPHTGILQFGITGPAQWFPFTQFVQFAAGLGRGNLPLTSDDGLLATDPTIVSQKKFGIGIGVGTYCHAERSEASQGHTRQLGHALGM